MLVRLTNEGMNLIQEAFNAHAKDLDELFIEFSEDERTQFTGLMLKLSQRSQEESIKISE